MFLNFFYCYNLLDGKKRFKEKLMKYLNKLVKEYCHLYFKTTYPFHCSPVRYILEKKKV